MKRILSLFLTLLLIISSIPLAALPVSAVIYSGACGDNVTYTLDTSTGTLTISGTGAMTDYTYSVDVPWNSSNVRSQIKAVVIKDGVTSIGDRAFDWCDSITSIIIPGSVISIGTYSFHFCRALKSVTIPNSVTRIGDYAFEYCSSLGNITISDFVTSIGYYAFDNTAYYSNSANWKNNVLYIGNYLIKAKASLFDRYIIREGTKCIADSAFSGCKSLVSVSIPDSIISIGDDAFYNCTSLANVTYKGTAEQWKGISLGARNVSLTSLIGCCGIGLLWTLDKNMKILTISGTGIMMDYSTSSNVPWNSSISLIKDIIIEEGVTSIGDLAFNYCTSLTSITIPDSVTSIGDYAFYNCNSLESIVIPNSVTSIEKSAFGYCSSLKTINFIGYEEEWNSIDIKSGNDYLLNADIIFNYGQTVIVPGDADGDGVVNSRDVLTLKKYIAGKGEISEDFIQNIDMTGDGVINSRDMLMLKRKIIGNV